MKRGEKKNATRNKDEIKLQPNANGLLGIWPLFDCSHSHSHTPHQYIDCQMQRDYIGTYERCCSAVWSLWILCVFCVCIVSILCSQVHANNNFPSLNVASCCFFLELFIFRSLHVLQVEERERETKKHIASLNDDDDEKWWFCGFIFHVALLQVQRKTKWSFDYVRTKYWEPLENEPFAKVHFLASIQVFKHKSPAIYFNLLIWAFVSLFSLRMSSKNYWRRLFIFLLMKY